MFQKSNVNGHRKSRTLTDVTLGDRKLAEKANEQKTHKEKVPRTFLGILFVCLCLPTREWADKNTKTTF